MADEIPSARSEIRLEHPHHAAGQQRQAETAALGDAVAELAARIQAATYELLVMINEFDARGGWGQGFTSCAHWLNWRTGLAMGAAREKVRVARALADLPAMSAAMARGALSYSKVRALTRVATPETEERLLGFARCATATRLDNLVLVCRRHHRAVHEQGFRVALSDSGEACFFWPDGRPFPAVPSAPTWAGTPLASTDAYLDAAGLMVGPDTATPDWHGERLDEEWAIRVLHPAAARPSRRDLPAGTRSIPPGREVGPVH